jgi:GNAT superfamily N-acetyltransferase
VTVEVTRADPGQVDQVSALVAESFEPLAASGWLVPEPSSRRRLLKANVKIYVEHALHHGHIDVIGEDAAAVWFHHDTGEELPQPDDYDERLIFAVGKHLRRFRALDEAFDANHPHGTVHHHLAFLAVRPDSQGSGLGTALLREHHRRLDESGTPGYLEASSERSRELYLRNGYRLHGEPFYLPDGPPFWPMWREPVG